MHFKTCSCDSCAEERGGGFKVVFAATEGLVSQRARLTFPNGFQKVGLVENRRGRLFIGGTLFGGENASAVKVERMADTGRYVPVWSVAS